MAARLDPDCQAAHVVVARAFAAADRWSEAAEAFEALHPQVRVWGPVLDPALVREAVALEAGTLVLAVGARPGVAFTPSTWEEKFLARGAHS